MILFFDVKGGEADDHDVDVRLASRLAFPRERAVGKMNLHDRIA